jgi:hypothetical protein
VPSYDRRVQQIEDVCPPLERLYRLRLNVPFTYNMSLFSLLLPLFLFSTSSLSQCWQDVACTGPIEPAFTGVWDASIFASANRTVVPKGVLAWPDLNLSSYPQAVVLRGNGSLVTYDFGKEVGGIVSISFSSSGTGQLGFAFTEAKDYVGEWSDSSNGNFTGPDGALYTELGTALTTYTMPENKLRGGFRYMTVFLITNSTASATLEDVNITLDFQPTWPNLRAYQGYFHSDDNLLNRAWYSGAYTLQSNSIPSNTGRQVPFVGVGWDNNGTVGPGDTVIVDGAKRDRAVWPGDMVIAVPSTFFSLGDLTSVKNALQVMYNTQNTTSGAFAESGPPLSQLGSDTYHMWTMIGMYNYFLYTNDTNFLASNWEGYELAMRYISAKIDNSSLLNVTGIRDWARWQQGFHNTEANAILYHTLLTGARLATWQQNASLASTWTTSASTLGAAINMKCFDTTYGAYKDNDTMTSLHPQDANSLSLLFKLATNTSIPSIATRLTSNWTPIGPASPELPFNISPFITSFELLGRFTVRDTQRALSLLRTTWGWILNNPNSTQSTLIEGYLTNGSFGYRSNRGYDYDASYTSHSHGWSSGPTSALTNYVVGLDIVEPMGSVWTLAPQMGDLTSVEAGFTTGLGRFQADWRNSSMMLQGTWETPVGTKGTVTVPVADGKQVVKFIVNGTEMDFRAAAASGQVQQAISVFGEGLLTLGVVGGNGSIEIVYT